MTGSDIPRCWVKCSAGLGLYCVALSGFVVACGSESETPAEPAEQHATGDEAVSLPGVDLGPMTRAERRMFRRIVEDQLSPCDEPVSLATCVAEERACKACGPAVRYLRRLVLDGHSRATIEERLRARYRPDGAASIPVGDAPVRGSAMAPITVVEFSDFECPSCGAAHPVIASALQRFPDQVRFVMMNYPLPSHPNAGEAARAAVAAGRQDRFWEMHDLLFEHQHALNRARIVALAREIGIDEARFLADLESDAVRDQVDAQKELGRRLNIEGTPTFFVNGRRFLDSPRTLAEYLSEEIDALP